MGTALAALRELRRGRIRRSRARRRSWLAALLVTVTVTVTSAFVVKPLPAQALTTPLTFPCTVPYVMYGLRGSGELPSDAHGYGNAVGPAEEQISSVLQGLGYASVADPVSVGPNGTGDGTTYPAVSVPWVVISGVLKSLPVIPTTWPLLVAAVSSLLTYQQSMTQGATALRRLLNAQAAACPGSSQKYILLGYSQGAQALGNGIATGLTLTAKHNIAAVVRIADPRFNAKDVDSAGHPRSIGTYDPQADGLFGGRTDLGVYKDRMLSYCLATDLVCQRFRGGYYVHTLNETHLGPAIAADVASMLGLGHQPGSGSLDPDPWAWAVTSAGGTNAIGTAANDVHSFGPKGCIQDFSGGSSGTAALIQELPAAQPAIPACEGHDFLTNTVTVFPVMNQQWTYLKAVGVTNLGYPTSNPHRWGNGISQDFAKYRGSDPSLAPDPAVVMTSDATHNTYSVGKFRAFYSSLGGPSSALGYPTSETYTYGNGSRQEFEGGSIIDDGNTGPRTLYALGQGPGNPNPQPFVDAFNRWGAGVLGSSLSLVHTWGPGCIQDLAGGTAGQSALMQANCSGPVFVVQGDQWAFYKAQYGMDPTRIGYPTEDVHRWGAGWSQQFGSGGTTPTTLMKGDHVGAIEPMWGGIGSWYFSRGGPTSQYGYPTTDEYQFQGVPRRDFEAGSAVWVNGGAHDLAPVGAWATNIQSFVDEFNGASGYAGMGFPVDYVHAWGPGCTQDYVGGYNTKSVIMSANCSGGAYRVVGEQWAYLESHSGGSAAQEYGYPMNDVHRYGNGWTQDFQGGKRAWNLIMKGDAVGQVYNLQGGIRDKYLSQGGANGWLGYPTTDEYNWNGYICQGFQGDTICWSASDGAELMNIDLSIVDNSTYFWGPAQYLTRFTGLGFNNDMYRTYAEGSGRPAVNGAEWIANITGGTYRIDVYIPRSHATCVTNYYVRWNGGQSTVAVNQNIYYDQWVSLGRFSINGPQASVGSNDSTGTRGCEIGWDAIRWVKVG